MLYGKENSDTEVCSNILRRCSGQGRGVVHERRAVRICLRTWTCLRRTTQQRTVQPVGRENPYYVS